MLNVLKVRIYPNKEQELALAKNLGCVRFVWNYYLNKTNNQYLETGKGMTYCAMAKDLTKLKKQPDFEKRVWGESRIPRPSVSLTAGVSM